MYLDMNSGLWFVGLLAAALAILVCTRKKESPKQQTIEDYVNSSPFWSKAIHSVFRADGHELTNAHVQIIVTLVEEFDVFVCSMAADTKITPYEINKIAAHKILHALEEGELRYSYMFKFLLAARHKQLIETTRA